jgi:uncharacterized protein (DUF433 family)
MEIAPHINVDPQICSGSPVITGTRIHVSIVVGSLAGGMTMQELMDEYGLTRAQIEGAIDHNHLETLMLEGLNSGSSTPMTADDWAYIRTAVRQNLSQDNATRSPDEIEEIRESIYRGWQDALAGRTKPVSQLWEGLDAD